MNAYELAEQLDNFMSEVATVPMFTDHANMLRELQDKVFELEEHIEKLSLQNRVITVLKEKNYHAINRLNSTQEHLESVLPKLAKANRHISRLEKQIERINGQ